MTGPVQEEWSATLLPKSKAHTTTATRTYPTALLLAIDLISNFVEMESPFFIVGCRNVLVTALTRLIYCLSYETLNCIDFREELAKNMKHT